MKKKTLVIFVCTLLITTVLPAIGAMNDKTTWYMNDNSYSESNPSAHANPLGLIHIEIVGNVYDMVDADDRFLPGPGQRLGRRYPDQQGADQARALSNGNGVNLRGVAVGLS